MKYNPHKHHRRSIRLKGYDYAQEGLYFITICSQDRAHLFGHIDNAEMILNAYGKIAHIEWQNTEKIRNNCRIHEFIIMPNHIHGIIEILFKKENKKEQINGEDKKDRADKEGSTGELQFAPTGKFQSPSQTIGSIIRGFKIATIKKIKDFILKEEEFNPNSEGINPNNPRGIDINNLGESNSSSTGELQFAPTEKIISLDFKIWQRNYYEHIIRTEKAYQRISNYIITNPINWEKDRLK